MEEEEGDDWIGERRRDRAMSGWECGEGKGGEWMGV